jgi:molybdopterin-guanine dinucleotide biosynthesis protein A
MFTIVIQAGGESRRMGQDKALMPFLGQPLIARVVKRVIPIADEVLVTTNRPEDYGFLGLPLFPDLAPGRGALGGLYTALSAASHPLVAVIACDMPFINAGLLAAQRDMLDENQVDAVVPRLEGGTEPFHAVYRRQECLLPIEEALAADKWRVDAWFSQVRMLYLSPEEIKKYDPGLQSFLNANTPEEMQAALELARQMNE